MFVETIKTPGLAHLSYVVGSAGKAAVIDPRRDADVYLDIARQRGCTITHIFETHRNEDYVIGSGVLAERTGAAVHHGRHLDFAYGHPAREGDEFLIGDIVIYALETPGHTYESLSYVLTDTASQGKPVAVFTGDALFVADVGRTDFFPDKAKEVAGLLFDSIHQKLLPLGDHVVLYPAHGAGSVCGMGMADRDFSTLGLERVTNPKLQLDREAFIQGQTEEWHPQPPYFRRMEELNITGEAPALCALPQMQALNSHEFAIRRNEGMTVLDVRDPEAVAGAFIPGSLSVPSDMIAAYAGYFLDDDKDIGLVADNESQAEDVRRMLFRMGYDRVEGWLLGGLAAWESSSRRFERIGAVHVGELVERIESQEKLLVLDVRKPSEWEAGHLPRAKHIFLGELPDRLGELPVDMPIVTFCGSGRRAIIAASILKRSGFPRVEDALGSLKACEAYGCPIEKDAAPTGSELYA
jgi:hydroxyacylglutathione hydrolase